MRTTSDSGEQPHPDAQHNRDQAWARLTQTPSGGRRLPSRSGSSPGRLMDIARNYDRICQRADGTLLPDATDADLLAALLAIRMLREKLDHDELKLTSLARTKKITWARIAQWQELSGRQAAERRHLQLSRAYTRPDGTVPRTQSERVEQARERRSRRAERDWARQHAQQIRRIAAQLAAISDLQERVDRSQEARVILAVRGSETKSNPEPVPLVWPTALRDCIAEDERFRSTPPQPPDAGDLDSPEWHRQQQEADILHRLLGLVRYGANPRNIDLSDLADLADAIRDLHRDSQQQTKTRRPPGPSTPEG
ncbi:hypothetical protein [Streptomyces sp. ALI-76-A]|uniref:hypothetical protein n=1 Tax=Streptomyces sp. ALI-76-A TaxID=3025736 RepID=UPI00256EC760|nr:hypothetical protein [Streptomyces sp. ALI-76-A]MDL5199528.1 hypothetical protein [Streptomyces sp. ALI-76-A]